MVLSRSESIGKRTCETIIIPWEALRDTGRVFCRSPNLAKVTVAAGLQLAAMDIAPAFDMGPDPYDAWKKDGGGAYHMALFQCARAGWALITSPVLVYFADKVDKRMSYTVLALISCVPTWTYWFVDTNNMEAAWVNLIASIFAATGTTTDMAFALAMDVTPFEDRELAFGGFYALKHFIAFLLAPLPCLIFIVGDCLNLREPMLEHPRVILIYQLVLAAAFMLATATVNPTSKGSEDDERSSSKSAYGNTRSTEGNRVRTRDMLCAGFEMVRTMWTDYRLFRLCLAGFILALCRTTALGNNGQYYYQVLQLDHGHSEGYIDVNIYRNFSNHVALPMGFMLTGYFAMKSGALRTLRYLIPMTALLLLSGMLMEVVKTIWFTAVVEFLLSMTDLYNGPLRRIVAGVAKPGKVGSWLNMFGVAVEVGVMLGSLVIFAINYSYWRLVGDGIVVWPYYPICGSIVMLALWPLWTDTPGPPDSRKGWGAAAGLPTEVLHSTLGALRAATVWKRKTIRARDQRTQEDDSGSSSDSDSDGHGILSSIVRTASFLAHGLHVPGPLSRQTTPASGCIEEEVSHPPRNLSSASQSLRSIFSSGCWPTCQAPGDSSSDDLQGSSVSESNEEDNESEAAGPSSMRGEADGRAFAQ